MTGKVTEDTKGKKASKEPLLSGDSEGSGWRDEQGYTEI